MRYLCLVTFILAGVVLHYTYAHAQEAQMLESGEPAPYTGVLMQPEHAAKLLARVQTAKYKLIEYESILAECTAELDKKSELVIAIPDCPEPIGSFDTFDLILGMLGGVAGGILIGVLIGAFAL